MVKYPKVERAESIERLRSCVKPGQTVYCILRSCARSGMSREISLLVFDGESVFHLDYNAAIVLGYSSKGNGHGVRIGGCGMDMGFALVYELSRALFNDPNALKHRWL